MKLVKKFFFLAVPVIVVGLLSACAQVKVSSQLASGYQGHIERLSIYSSIGSIGLLGNKMGLLKLEPFSSRFDAALKRNFQAKNISTDIHDFTAKTVKQDKIETFKAAEEKFRPNMRLFIQPTRYQIATIRGSSMVSGLWLYLGLVDLKSHHLVWHSSIFVDPGLDPTAWMNAGADKLSKQIVKALEKDKLMS